MGIRKTLRTLLHGDPLDSGIDADKWVVFFPTAAHLEGAGKAARWRVPIHGWIYHPTEFSRLRRAGLWMVKRLVPRQARGDAQGMAFFKQRAGAFFADNERWERVNIRLGEGIFRMKRSQANGHFYGELEVPPSQAEGLLTGSGAAVAGAGARGGAWVSFRAVTRSEDQRVFGGRALLLPAEGVSVISDIDDTIKVTEATSRRRMLANTFLREFACVPEMAGLYRRWAAGGAAFHYVSASPWHLYPFLAAFLREQGFPEGTFHLRDFRLLPADWHRTLRPSRRIKLRHARKLMEQFPRRRFVLVGDSGECDPAIYARLYHLFPRQVAQICIRNVTGEGPEAGRWKKAFAGIPPKGWRVFEEPEELIGAGPFD